MSEAEKFQVLIRVCTENFVAALNCLGNACRKAMVEFQRLFLVNRRTRRAAAAGRMAAARWYAAEHKRRSIGDSHDLLVK